MNQSVRDQLQHVLNPLHVYCRLKEAGLTEAVARRLTETYERAFYRRVLSHGAASVKGG